MKKVIAAVMVAAFAAAAGAAFAAKAEKCTVDAVDGDKITITCKETALKTGDKVEVKVKEDKPVEGC
ncbi:MAG: selenite/tellurite reduction operon protein ExtJ [Candidatus Electronema sp. V4]|uniref:selenite/tellurite reduction operon protein ExtJ n=1 Tax=Candidatus Electronema sp. V4 TaxID=3454756 RepID=UPI0040555815